jgi:hypothetical protein
MSSQYSKPRRTSTTTDPLAHPGIYYGESHTRRHARARTYSAVRRLSLPLTRPGLISARMQGDLAVMLPLPGACRHGASATVRTSDGHILTEAHTDASR